MAEATRGSGNRIVSHTSIYLFGDVLRYSVSLIMLPIYTRYLTPEDYGVVELLSMLIDFAAILFGVRVGQSVFRFYCDEDDPARKNTIIASALFLGVLFDGIGTAAVILFSEPLSVAIFSDTAYAGYITLYAIAMFMVPLTEIPLLHIRAQQRPWLFFMFSGLKLLLQVALNIYFVVYREMHVEGVIYSAIISSTIMAVLLTGYSVASAGIRIRMDTCKQLFSFSLPIKLATIGSFYLTFGDRYILNIYTDLTEVGLYSLGYKFGFIFTLIVWMPFEKMWDSEKYTVLKQDNPVQVYQKVFLLMSTILIFTGLGFSLFTKDLLRIMSDPVFVDAHQIVPMIIMAYIIQSWSGYCNFGILYRNKTSHIAYAEALAVIVITIAYFSLIPPFGMHGAAWATVFGFSARLLWTHRKATQLYDMALPWKKVSLIAGIAILSFGVSTLIPDGLLLSIGLRTLLYVATIALFFALPVLSMDEKKEIWQKIGRLKDMVRARPA